MAVRLSQYARQKRKRFYFQLAFFVVVFLIIVATLSFVSYRKSLRIHSVDFTGGVLVTQNDLEKEVLEFLSGTYFWLFPRDNFLLYPRRALSDDLSAKFQRIDTISIKLKNTQTLSITISERKPDSLWCGFLIISGAATSTSQKDFESDECYFMDDRGMIFAKAPQFSGDAYFKYFGSISTSSEDIWPIGQKFLASTTEFENLSDFVSRVSNMALSPQFLVVKDDGQYELMLSGGGQIYFDNKNSFSKQADNLFALLHSDNFTATSVGEALDYIDLRFGNKIFYKLK